MAHSSYMLRRVCRERGAGSAVLARQVGAFPQRNDALDLVTKERETSMGNRPHSNLGPLQASTNSTPSAASSRHPSRDPSQPKPGRIKSTLTAHAGWCCLQIGHLVYHCRQARRYQNPCKAGHSKSATVGSGHTLALNSAALQNPSQYRAQGWLAMQVYSACPFHIAVERAHSHGFSLHALKGARSHICDVQLIELNLSCSKTVKCVVGDEVHKTIRKASAKQQIHRRRKTRCTRHLVLSLHRNETRPAIYHLGLLLHKHSGMHVRPVLNMA